ncbi:hypothetical protein ANN_22116 [Periplaneta americana]|uniref:ribonuclease H n=1 Tax=Periplaneta americana TaxID=6978 RepID=A0ABQ8S779_PERAM|nr:hypothetical protein ANN_22116 [Periplaneta americana]
MKFVALWPMNMKLTPFNHLMGLREKEIKRRKGVQCRTGSFNVSFGMFLYYVGRKEASSGQALRTAVIKATKDYYCPNFKGRSLRGEYGPCGKLLRNNDDYCSTYLNTERYLKTQYGLIQYAEKLKEELDIPNLLQPLMLPQNPLQIDIIQSEIDLLEQITKNKHSKENLKRLVLETTNIRYPEDYWIKIYTDGSKTDPQGNVGAGIFSNLFRFYLTVGSNLSAYDGEIEGIHVALNQLLLHMDKFTNAVILSDSKAAILSINKTDHPYTEQINNCQKILATLKEHGKTVVLQWIPGHCNLHGNEQAHTLAKKGANLKINPRKPLKLLKDIPPEPRRLAVASFRLNTEHDILGKHLNHLGILPSASCILCHQQEDMDRQHLAKCPALKSSKDVDRYWEPEPGCF